LNANMLCRGVVGGTLGWVGCFWVKYQTNTATNASPTTPPTTPPAMAPVFEPSVAGGGVGGVGGGGGGGGVGVAKVTFWTVSVGASVTEAVPELGFRAANLEFRAFELMFTTAASASALLPVTIVVSTVTTLALDRSLLYTTGMEVVML
jgi:hypothetical protein